MTYVDRAEDVKTKGLYAAYNLHLGRPFYIRSRLPMQRVVTVVGKRNLVLKTMDRTNPSQVFFLDPSSKTIKSVANDHSSIDIQGGGSSANVQIWTTSGRWFQLFRYDKSGAFVNVKDGRALDVSGNRDRENQNIILFKRHNSLNQQWDITYLDTLKADIKDGEYSPQFGMYIGKNFSIKTKLGSGRFVDVIGDQVVLKSRSTRASQKWFFDFKTRTIKNSETKKSLMISDSGKGNNLKLWNTNSEWW